MKKMFLMLFTLLTVSVLSSVYTMAQGNNEQLPQFPGGDKALMEFVAHHLNYPEQAVKDKVQGNVFVEFVVNAQGDIEDAKILRSLSPECDAEVLRIVGIMPQWIPAMKDGEPIDVKFVLPVTFRM